MAYIPPPISKPNIKWKENDLKRLRKTLNKFIKNIEYLSYSEPKKLALKGQRLAQMLAPVYSGTLIKAIKYQTMSGTAAKLYVDENILFTNPNNQYGRAKNFNYAAYMHETGGAMGMGRHITSGDASFMFTTRDLLFEKLKADIKIKVSRYW